MLSLIDKRSPTPMTELCATPYVLLNVVIRTSHSLIYVRIFRNLLRLQLFIPRVWQVSHSVP